MINGPLSDRLMISFLTPWPACVEQVDFGSRALRSLKERWRCGIFLKTHIYIKSSPGLENQCGLTTMASRKKTWHRFNGRRSKESGTARGLEAECGRGKEREKGGKRRSALWESIVQSRPASGWWTVRP